MVDLLETAAASPATEAPPSISAAVSPGVDPPEADPAAETSSAPPPEGPAPGATKTADPPPAQALTAPPLPEVSAASAAGPGAGEFLAVSASQPQDALPGGALPPLRKPGEFLATDRELLRYRITMAGIPVGDAELEARLDKGEVRITLHVRTNPATSQLYRVDDLVETRHIGGNFILSRIRQQEGSFRGDKGFTLFLREKSVFWVDRIKKLSISEALPNNSVVDILSGLYYLRNQPLEVGTSVVLQLFDSTRYAPTTVDVVRREHVTFPGLREVDTLVVNPQIKSKGFSQRTGDILVWLTDDEKKVPVKFETRMALGRLTAELVSSESQKHGEAPAKVDAMNITGITGR